MKKILILFVFIFFILIDAKRRFVDPVKYAKIDTLKTYNYTTTRTDSIFPVDHFAYTNTDKFSLKYLYNDKYYVKGSAVFFYAGNEGKIEDFADNTGIVWDLAPQFKAMIVFAEHRYYGDSMPYANNDSWTNINKLGYLTSIQALADYAMFLPWFRNKHNIDVSSKVIVFGGSYGGMLATWFRLNAWASSAPVTYFSGGDVPVGGFDSVVRDTFLASGCQNATIAATFAAVTNLGNSVEGRKQLNTIFKMDPATLLNTAEDVKNLKLYIQTGMEYMAMTDYPYSSNFLQPMPAWPVSEACKRFGKVMANSSSIDLATALFDASNVYYNYNNNNQKTCLDPSKCNDQSMGSLSDGPDGWDFQECTEIIIEMCSLGQPNDFFDQNCNDNATFLAFQKNLCSNIYGQIGWKSEFLNIDGVKNLYGWDFSQATNIIFTNGKYDPWSIGGVKNTTFGIKNGLIRGIYTFMIDGSAHHLDLRQPMNCDPLTVVNARFQIVQIINCWLNLEKNCPFVPTTLPAFQSINSTNCEVQKEQYPWGQKNSEPTTSVSTVSTSIPITKNASTLTLNFTFLTVLFKIFILLTR